MEVRGVSVLSVAPMIGWTDRHYRYLMRHITAHTELFTEMTMDKSIIYNQSNLNNFIGYNDIEYPLALQMGGNDPDTLARAVEIASSYRNYSQINLNCGCPSNKAKKAGFGCELMLEPELVRKILSEMVRRSNIDITVKCRIGTDRSNSYSDLVRFVNSIRDCGVKTIILHSRVCILKGLSPAQNRTVPPLRYDVIHRLVSEYPELSFILNGGITTFDQADNHLRTASNELTYSAAEKHLLKLSNATITDNYAHTVFTNLSTENDVFNERNVEILSEPCSYDGCYYPPVSGVMIGREAYNNPFIMANADSHFFNKRNPNLTRRQVLERYCDYTDRISRESADVKACPKLYAVPTLCKPLHNFFHGSPANKAYKQNLDAAIKAYSIQSRRRVARNQEQSLLYDFDALKDNSNSVIGPKPLGYGSFVANNYSDDDLVTGGVRAIVQRAMQGTISNDFLDEILHD